MCAANSINQAVTTNGAVNVGIFQLPVTAPIAAVITDEKATANNITTKLIGEPGNPCIGQRNPKNTPITASQYSIETVKAHKYSVSIRFKSDSSKSSNH